MCYKFLFIKNNYLGKMVNKNVIFNVLFLCNCIVLFIIGVIWGR